MNFSSLTHSHITKLKDAFQTIDEDGDGVISQQDLNKILCSLGKQLPDSQLQAMLQGPNCGSEDGVTFPRFLSLMSATLGDLPEESEIAKCLKTLSDKGDLQLPLVELIARLKEAGFQNPEKDFARILSEFSTENHINNEKVFKGDQFLNTFSE